MNPAQDPEAFPALVISGKRNSIVYDAMRTDQKENKGEEKLRQGNQDREWQQVDARVLGQMLAMQNFLFLLPHEKQIAEFFSEAIGKIPGVASCLVCLGGPPEPAGTVNDLCNEWLTGCMSCMG